MRSRLRRWMARVRVRVTVAATLAAALIGFVGSVVFVLQLRAGLEHDLETTSAQQVSTIVAQLQRGESADEVVVSGKNDVVVQLVRDGRIVATDHPRVTRPLSETAGTTRHVRVPGLEDEYVVSARRHAPYLVVVGRSAEEIGRATAESTLLLAFAVPVGLALLALVIWVSVGRALRPVEGMRRAADRITTAHLHRRLDVPDGGDEVGRLAATLNAMLDRIDASQRLQRQFVSDASHELRSPLSAIRQLSEVARDYPDRADAAELAGEVLLEEQRMEHLVSALLVLARLDDDEHAGPGEPVDLDDVVLLEARRLRTDDGPCLDVSRVGAGQVLGHPVLLGQVVRNLLANAVRHARTTVTVSLVEDAGHVVLTVDDDGNGVPESERERVFERFVRLDESRTRDDGGSGLGLAIVRKVVEAGRGTVEVSSAPTGGARFVVTLPAA